MQYLGIKYLTCKLTNFQLKKKLIVKIIKHKKEKESTPQHFCVAED